MWGIRKRKEWADGGLWKCEYLIHPRYSSVATNYWFCILKELLNQGILFESNGQKFYLQK